MTAQTVLDSMLMLLPPLVMRGPAWIRLQLVLRVTSITGAAEITAIASDQGFAESSTVAGQATAQADQSAIGMDGYSINNSPICNLVH